MDRMLPSLTLLSPLTLLFNRTSNTPTFDKHGRSGDGFPDESDSVQIILSDLPPEVKSLVLQALAKYDCEGFDNFCNVDQEFRQICREDDFWQAILNEAKWAPDWSPIESTGGMTPKAYYKMICGMKDPYQKKVLALSLNMTEIGTGAFDGFRSLALRQLPPNVTKIGDFAFMRCSLLALTQLPPTLKVIGYGAFADCSSLALKYLPPNLKSIFSFAFMGCSSLDLTHLPNTVRYIGDGAFVGCEQLRDRGFGAQVLRINSKAFQI